MKVYQESKKKTPTELLYIEVIKKAFSDVFTKDQVKFGISRLELKI